MNYSHKMPFVFQVGKKNLFLLDRGGKQHEVTSNCILDFYVHESRQRTGCGKRIFEFMLADQGLHPTFMAIDRPSPKLLGFLRKYYGLANPIPQARKTDSKHLFHSFLYDILLSFETLFGVLFSRFFGSLKRFFNFFSRLTTT